MKTDKKSDAFQIEKGTKQGDPVSPIIFNVVVEMFMAKLKHKRNKRNYGIEVDDFTSVDLRYASSPGHYTNQTGDCGRGRRSWGSRITASPKYDEDPAQPHRLRVRRQEG